MTPADAFLQAIAESPEDTPRLVYADWLDEHGEEVFAQFIRVQCELAQHEQADARRRELKGQEEDLWGELKRQWSGHFANLGRPDLKLGDFRRGLLDEVNITVEPEVFVREAPRWLFLLRVGELRLRYNGADFFACPQLWRVRSLNCFRAAVGDAGLLPFADARHFHNLERIDLSATAIGPGGIAAFARCPSLTGLTELALGWNEIGDEGVRALVASPVCRNLTVLRLNANDITDDGACAIAASPYVANLRELHLRDNPISHSGLEELESSLTNCSLDLSELDEDEVDADWE
jgi:uncharacterized protein (TIGR02996 family)